MNEIRPFFRDFRYEGPTSDVLLLEDERFRGYPQDPQAYYSMIEEHQNQHSACQIKSQNSEKKN